ncbi:MAG: DHH family phosphoesterase [Ruminococcus sp.]|nr:DHH family phosphoesterase [Ruminococcus sp.]MCM1392755.1 DHH family phosphoesterase [Ruminococcus sp.]
MKKLWKKFDTFLIELVAAIIFVAITAYFNLWVAACEFVCVAIIVSVKLYYTKTQKEKLLYQVGAVAEELDFEQGKAFSTLTVSCCVIDENGKVIWFNDSFKNSFEIDENMSKNNIRNILKREKIDKMLEGRGFRIKIDSRYFAVYSSEIGLENECVYLLYFFDETKLRLVEKEYYDTRPSIMLSVIDNADEIYQNFKESDCAAIFSRIEKMIDDWASSYGALCRKFSNARMLIFAEERGLQKMISDKFSILNDIRQLTYNDKPTEVTLSIGIGKEADLNDANNSAKQALDMAQSRGGDQVAIKHEAQYKFYGGVSEGFEKKNKVRTRLIAKTVAEIIKDSDNVLIMGHRFSDFDAIGSAIGMYCIAEHFSIPANIVVDRQTTLAGALVDKLCSKYGDDLVISPGSAASHVKENTLVIVVDTHKQDFTECPALIDKAGKVMVIDHHRKSVSFIEDTVVFYHMPNSSSASEMVTELVQYVDSKPVIDPLAAQALFAGIMLDTKNFVIRTGVRTFEAAAYLKSRSANTVEVKKLFANDMEIFRERNAVIDAAVKYRDECAISVANFESKNIRLITSQASDEMLNIDGVKASFVLYRSSSGINISARSFGEINVQLIMENMGGGGHQAMSACQLSDITMESAIEKLKSSIDKYLDK